jgi:hypothetical protein
MSSVFLPKRVPTQFSLPVVKSPRLLSVVVQRVGMEFGRLSLRGLFFSRDRGPVER